MRRRHRNHGSRNSADDRTSSEEDRRHPMSDNHDQIVLNAGTPREHSGGIRVVNSRSSSRQRSGSTGKRTQRRRNRGMATSPLHLGTPELHPPRYRRDEIKQNILQCTRIDLKSSRIDLKSTRIDMI